MRAISNWLASTLGKVWLTTVLGVMSTAIFSFIVPAAVGVVTTNRTVVPKILDEYMMTWTPEDARHLYSALGPQGRLAYQAYYLHLDFWFPVLTLSLFYVGLLSLAFPRNSRFELLNLLPSLLYFSDAAENLNHFMMARLYPNLPAFSLQFGPAFTYIKWVLISGLLVLAIMGFAAKALNRGAENKWVAGARS